MLILGIDPGLSNMGIARVRLGADRPLVEVADVLCTTKRSSKKRDNVYASADDARRAGELAHAVMDHLNAGEVVAVCSETRRHLRGSVATAALAIGWTVVVTLARVWDLPVFEAGPTQIKRALGVPANQGKEAIAQAVDHHYPEVGDLVAEVPANRREHAYDAVGAVHACLENKELHLLRKMARPTSPPPAGGGRSR